MVFNEPAVHSQRGERKAGLGPGSEQSQTEPAVRRNCYFHSYGVTRQQMGELASSFSFHRLKFRQ